MKTILLLAIAVWSQTAAMSYGQRDLEAEQRAAFAKHRASMEAMQDEAREGEANYKKAIETGRDLFGVDDRWAGDKLAGTLKHKQSSQVINSIEIAVTKEYKIGDWGCTDVTFRVINRVSKTECLVQQKYAAIRGHSDPPTMLLRGLDMSKVTDGVEFVLQQPVWIDSTYDYTTVGGGQKTVLVLDHNAGKLKEIEAKLSAETKAKKQAAIEHAKAEEERAKAIEAAKWRTWTDATGTHKIEAKFSGMLSRTVKLIKHDGSTISLPLEKLSDVDQAWIANRTKR